MDRDGISVSVIQTTSWIVLIAMAVAAAVAYSRETALSILAGGAISSVSFLWMKRDVRNILAGPLQAAKILFFLKYYARLAILAVILYGIIRYQLVQVIGLLIGLSSVVFGIILAGAAAAGKTLFRMKEAA